MKSLRTSQRDRSRMNFLRCAVTFDTTASCWIRGRGRIAVDQTQFNCGLHDHGDRNIDFVLSVRSPTDAKRRDGLAGGWTGVVEIG